MQFTIVALLIGAVAAMPAAQLAPRDGEVCGSGILYSSPACCSTDVLGVADLSCTTPTSANDSNDLKDACTAVGTSAHCCTILAAGLGVLCKAV